MYKSLLKNAAILVGSNMPGPLISILLVPLITKLYSAEEFGLLGVSIAGATLLANLMTGKLELAFPKAKTRFRRELLFELSIVFSILVFIACLGFGLLLQLFSGLSYLRLVFIVLIALILSLSIITVSFRISGNKYRRVGYAKIISGLEPVFQLIFSLTNSAYRIILAYIVTNLISLGSLFDAGTLPRRIYRKKKVGILLAKKYIRYFAVSVPAYFINALSTHAVPILLALFYGNAIVGELFLVQRTLGGGVFLLSGIIGQLFYSEISAKYDEQSKDTTRKVYYHFIGANLILGCLLYAVLILLIPYINNWIDDSWSIDPDFLKNILLLYICQFIVVPLSQILNIIGKQTQQLMWDIFRSGMVLSAIFISYSLNMDVYETFKVYVNCMVVTYVILVIVHVKEIRAL